MFLALPFLYTTVFLFFVCTPSTSHSSGIINAPQLDNEQLRTWFKSSSLFHGNPGGVGSYASSEGAHHAVKLDDVRVAKGYPEDPKRNKQLNNGNFDSDHQYNVSGVLRFRPIEIPCNVTLINYFINYCTPVPYSRVRRAMMVMNNGEQATAATTDDNQGDQLEQLYRLNNEMNINPNLLQDLLEANQRRHRRSKRSSFEGDNYLSLVQKVVNDCCWSNSQAPCNMVQTKAHLRDLCAKPISSNMINH